MERWLQKDRPRSPAQQCCRTAVGWRRGRCGFRSCLSGPTPLLPSSVVLLLFSVVMCHLILPSQWVAEGALVPKEAR